MLLTKKNRSKSKVNITPLIDIIFLLVVFFMLSSSLQKQEVMSLAIGSNNAKEDEDQNKPLFADDVNKTRIVKVLVEEGYVNFSGEQTKHADVGLMAGKLLNQNPNTIYQIKPGKGISVQKLIAVVDNIRDVGGNKIIFSK